MKSSRPLSIIDRLKYLAWLIIIFSAGFSTGGYIVFKQNIRPEQLLSGRWYGELQNKDESMRWVTVRHLNGDLEKDIFITSNEGGSSYQNNRGVWRIEGQEYRAWSNNPYNLLDGRELVSIESKRFISKDISSDRLVFEFKTENTSIIGQWLDQFHHRPKEVLPYTETIKGNLKAFAVAAQEYLDRGNAAAVTFPELRNDAESGYEPPLSVAGETYEHLVYPSSSGKLAALTQAGDLIEFEH